MEVRRESKTMSRKQDREYERTVYTCGQDDIWVSVEVPFAQPKPEMAATALA